MRIKVDFSEFFDDERKLSVVNVNTEEAASVKDVLHKIIRMFKLSPTPHKRRRGGGDTSNEKLEFGLFEEGFYIPPEETSTVLQDIGILKLKPLSNVNEENITRKKKRQRAQKKEEDGEEEQFLESDDENTVRKRRRSKRHKEEEEEVTKEGRKNKRHKDEEEETTKEGRKSKRYKEEEEENTKERRKSKRHAVNVEENMRERKGRRRKDSVESDADEEEEEDAENIDNYKKGKRQSGKRSKFIAQTSDAEGSNEEQSKKTKRKGRHQSESDSEIEERKSKRKHKREAIRDTTSVTLIEKVEDAPLKDKKKSKKDKAKQEKEDLSESDDMKQTRSESASVPETKGRKCTRQSLVEVNEASAIHDSINVDKYEEKRSQEKEITTTNVIHVESDEASESSFSSDGSSEMMDIGNKVDEQGSVDSIPVSSITNEQCMLGIPEAKKRRKRKHSKGKKKHPQNEVEARYPCQSYAAKTSHNANVSSGHTEREGHPMKFQHKNSDVSTSSTRSHVLFKSDDEGEVTSVSNSGDGNEIEIVGTSPGPANKRHSDTGTPLLGRGLNAQINNQRCSSEYDLGQSFRQSTPRQRNNLAAVIEIEGDDAGSSDFQNTDLYRPVCGSTGDSTHRRFVQRSRNANIDSLATLRKMCENKTITIVNVNTTRSKTVKSRPVRIPSPVSHMRRGPPLPTFQSSNDISEAARNTFYNLLTLENRAVPLVVRTSRETRVESIEDIDDSDSDVSSEHGNSEVGKPDSHETGNKEVPVQVSSSPVTQNVSQGETDKDSYELLSIPSTSGNTESCNTSADKPGPSTKISRRVAPRSFHSIGTVLSSLKKPQDSCEETEKLQMMSDDDDEIEAIPLSPVEIKQEEKDPECSKSDGKEKDPECSKSDGKDKDTQCSKSDGEEKDAACSKSDGEEKDTACSKSDGEDKDSVCSKSDGDVTSTKGEVIFPEEVVSAELLNVKNELEEEQEEAIEPVPFVSETDPLSPTDSLASTAPYDMEESRQLMKEMITETLKEDLLRDLKVEGDEEGDSRFLKFPLMKTLPKVGEYIAVKTLSLDEKLRPVYSNYLQVQVLEVSGLTIKFKTVNNIKKPEDMKKVKYEDGVEEVDLTFEEEVDLTQDEQGEIMELDWRDINEPRLLFP